MAQFELPDTPAGTVEQAASDAFTMGAWIGREEADDDGRNGPSGREPRMRRQAVDRVREVVLRGVKAAFVSGYIARGRGGFLLGPGEVPDASELEFAEDAWVRFQTAYPNLLD